MNINFAPAPTPNQPYVDPNDIARRQALADALMKSAEPQQITSPWQGLAELSNAFFGTMGQKQVAADKDKNAKALADALGGGLTNGFSKDQLATIMALNPEVGVSAYEHQSALEEKAREADLKKSMGPYAGTSLDAQNWNIILQGDPSTPQYAAAYNQLFEQPKMQAVQTQNGLQLVPILPTVPPSVRKPSSGAPMPPAAAPAPAGQPAAPAAAPAAAAEPMGDITTPSSPTPAMPAPAAPQAPAEAAPAPGMPLTQPGQVAPAPGQPNIGQPITVPGTQPRLNEQQQRNRTLGEILVSDLPTINQNFDALADPKGQLLSKLGPIGNYWQSQEYQQAANGLRATVANVLYSLSGATANPGEVENQISILTPQFGDKPQTIADKKRRLNSYVQAVAQAAGDPALIKAARDASVAGLGQKPAGGDAGAPPAKISSDAEYDALPSGAVFIAPDGSTRKKP